MIEFHSISTFRRNIKALRSKPKNGYSSVITDICDSLTNKPIEEIRINNDMILDENPFTIIKLRVQNSQLRLSKANGFRLIYFVSKKEDKVALLSVYPKRGSLGLETINHDGIKSLLQEYINEIKTKELVIHDIHNQLEVKEVL